VSATGKIIFTGAAGLLGSEFKKRRPDLDYPAEKDFDITDYRQMEDYVSKGDYRGIFHAAAFTSPPKIDADPGKALQVNIIGTANVTALAMAHSLRLFYMSTDYVFRGDRGNYTEEDALYPVNKYAWSKLGGECAVRLYDDSLVIRTTFGPVPFPYDKAFIDQWTSRESVTTIVDMIAPLLDTDVRGVIHVGGKRKTVFEYAAALDNERTIAPLSIHDVPFTVPADTSLDCSKYRTLMDRN